MSLKPTRGTRVMVVEDDAVVAWDISNTLVDLGFEVVGTAASCDEALEKIAKDQPDIALMDIRLEGPIDGIETVKRLRQRFELPVVYLTSHGDEETLARAHATDPYGYLLKPFKQIELQIALDIAIRRHALEVALAARERLLHTTLQTIGEAVVTTDGQGVVRFLNRSAEQLLGVVNEDAVGRSALALAPLLDDRTRLPLSVHPIESALNKSSTLGIPALLNTRLPGSVLRPVACSASLVAPQDPSKGAVLVLMDLKPRRDLEEQLELSERMAALGRLAAGVAHELSNPLAAVVANLKFALHELDRFRAAQQRDADLNEVVRALSEAELSTSRTSRIVSDMKAFSNAPPAAPASSHLADVLDWLTKQRAQEQELTDVVITRSGDDDLWVHCDRARLGQAFLSILVNLPKLARSEGERQPNVRVIHIATSAPAAGKVTVTFSLGVPDLRAAPSVDPLLAWESTDASGLGAWLARGILQSVGGDLELRSGTSGASARVTLVVSAETAPRRFDAFAGDSVPPSLRSPARDSMLAQLSSPSVLPASRAFAASTPPGRGSFAPIKSSLLPSAAPPGPRGRVLAVDDDALVRKALTRTLQRRHDAAVVGSVAEALATLASSEPFDVILCDLMMPGQTGMDFYDAVAKEFPAQLQRIVFLTGGAFTPETEAFFQRIPNATLSKPFQPSELMRMIDDLLAAKG